MPAWRLRDTENLARVASYYTKTNPNTPLADRLRKIFERGEITEVHRFLATPALHPMVIVTHARPSSSFKPESVQLFTALTLPSKDE